MRIILFNRAESTISTTLYAMGLRVAFLLGDHLIYTGRPHHAWALLHYGPDMDIEYKMNILSENNRADAAELDELQAALQLSPDDPLYRKAARKVKKLFNAFCEETRLAIKREGYFSVEEIWQSGKVFQVLSLADDIETDDDYHMPYSKWLTLQTDDEAADINLLTGDFFAHPLINNTFLNINNPAAKDLTTTYMHHCFTLPNLAAISMAELIQVREALQETLATFRQRLDDWCNEFWYEGLEDENIDHFKELMLPSIADLQHQFTENPILQKHSRATLPENRLEVLMGEVPIQTMWQFYRDHQVIPPETWVNLQKAIEEDHRLNLRWPVIVVRSTGTMLRAENETAAHNSSRSWTKPQVNKGL